MTAPAVVISIADGGLGILPEDTSSDTAKIGVCSLGVANTIYSFRGPDTTSVKTTLGEGPLVESVCHHLQKSNGKTVHACKVTASVVGANSAVTKSNGSAPTVSLTGAPLDDYQGIIAIVASGALGVGTFKYTMDNGDVYSVTLTIPAGGSYVIPNSGITVTFASGTYTAGDTFSWTSTAPGFSNSDFATAADALIASPLTWKLLHLVGSGVDAAAALTLATTMGSKLDTAESSRRWARGIVELPAIDKALAITAFASFAHRRVAVVGGFLELVSDVQVGRVYKRSLGTPFTARVARVPISVDAARDETDSDLLSLAGVVRLVPSGAAAATGYNDEYATPGLDSARFVSATTIPGVPGFFITNPNLMAPPGSDFKWMQYGRVMDRACEVTNVALTKYLSKRIKVNEFGFILEKDAAAIERNVSSQLRAALLEGGHVSAVSAVVNRADNLLSSPILRVKIRITPVGYAKSIEAELSYFNPALTLPLAA